MGYIHTIHFPTGTILLSKFFLYMCMFFILKYPKWQKFTTQDVHLSPIILLAWSIHSSDTSLSIDFFHTPLILGECKTMIETKTITATLLLEIISIKCGGQSGSSVFLPEQMKHQKERKKILFHLYSHSYRACWVSSRGVWRLEAACSLLIWVALPSYYLSIFMSTPAILTITFKWLSGAPPTPVYMYICLCIY